MTTVAAPKLRPTLPPLPRYMRGLPIDARGFPVPWFVAWFDGKPDFRVIRPDAILGAIKLDRCWICGGPLGTRKVFVTGPASALQRLTTEPPSHLECAAFAVRACPFIANPEARRPSKPLPENSSPITVTAAANPGTYCMWTVRDYEPRMHSQALLMRFGDPEELTWWAAGREATRDEVIAGLDRAMERLKVSGRSFQREYQDLVGRLA